MAPLDSKDSTSIAASRLPKIAWGKGSYVWDTTGKRYIDGSGGPAVYCLGHGNDEVNAAIKDQLDRIAHGYRYNFTSDPLEDLTERIVRSCGADLSHMVFVSGGSEAVELALKLALQYHVARGEPSRCRFIARERSWHGNTLGALALSGFRERRAAFEAALVPVPRLSPANAYRPPPGVESADVAVFCAGELERKIEELGPGAVAAFVFEPVVGAAGGAVPSPAGYARLVREICDRHGVLMIADEVMCGAGRCGTWRALEHDGVAPDIMTVAKGLGGGYLPLGAAVYSAQVAEPIFAVHGGPMTGHTFTGHTASCAAGAAVQRIVEREGLLARVRDKGPALQAMLREALDGVDAIGDIRGRGFFVGIEFVADRATKEPFPADRPLFLKIRQRSLEHGLICYPSGGNVDGVRGDTVIIAPPYNGQRRRADRDRRSVRALGTSGSGRHGRRLGKTTTRRGGRSWAARSSSPAPSPARSIRRRCRPICRSRRTRSPQRRSPRPRPAPRSSICMRATRRTAAPTPDPGRLHAVPAAHQAGDRRRGQHHHRRRPGMTLEERLAGAAARQARKCARSTWAR